MNLRHGIGMVTMAATLGCGSNARDDSTAQASDSSFAELQERGAVAMGVDQYTSQHRFEDLPDGGRIELQRDTADAQDIATIRAHLQDITAAFGRGDFRIPGFVHDMEVPGTAIMAERRAHIEYAFSELPRGGQVRITTRDAAAIRAIHEFLAFQRSDHRTEEHNH